MKVALFTDIFRSHSVEDAVSLAAMTGFRYVELNSCRYWEPHVDFSSDDAANQVRQLQRSLERYGVRLGAVATSEDLASLDLGERRASVDYCCRAMGALDGLGCRLLTTPASGNNLLPLEPQRSALRESLTELGEEAERLGWIIALEIYPGHCLEDSTAALTMLDAIDLPVGYLFCVSHIAALGEDVLASYAQAAPRIVHVHLSDTPAASLNHRHLIPGRGEVDCAALLHSLMTDDYGGFVSLQIYSHADTPVESAIEGLSELHALLAAPSPERAR